MSPLRTLIAIMCTLLISVSAAPVDNIGTTAGVIVPSVNGDNTTTTADLTEPDTNVKAIGQATWYVAALGACGVTNNGDTQDIVALPVGLMGSRSNDNPFCGRRVRISYNGRQATGTVQDKCMGCSPNSIDLSKHLFLQLAPLSVGRLHGVSWDLI